jgi:hypothetical protein
MTRQASMSTKPTLTMVSSVATEKITVSTTTRSLRLSWASAIRRECR